MREIGYTTMLREAIEQLQKGAFLTTRSGDLVNTMTIAWGNIGYMWNKPVFTVLVRPSRYTFELIETSDSFTVSLPVNEDMKKALSYCGTVSGRAVDKFKDLGLTLQPGIEVDTPIIQECSLHYECRIIGKQILEPGNLVQSIEDKAYETGNYHTLYYGEIVKCYINE